MALLVDYDVNFVGIIATYSFKKGEVINLRQSSTNECNYDVDLNVTKI